MIESSEKRVLETVFAVTRERFALDESFELRPEFGIDDIPGLDSLNFIAFVLAVQERFGTVLPIDAMAEIETLGEIAAACAKQLALDGSGTDSEEIGFSVPAGGFISLPERGGKPRRTGLTCMIDTGIGAAHLRDIVDTAGSYIDYVKFGWGTGLVTASLDEKIEILKKGEIGFWFGGSLFELARKQNRIDAYLDWINERGCETVEIASGIEPIPNQELQDLTARFKDTGLGVFVEVGTKSDQVQLRHADWVEQIRMALAAGADFVICEGRESGSAGLYHQDGTLRNDLIDEIRAQGIDTARLIWEAPRKAQQVWFVETFGPNCNLGNIATDDAISLETLRLGLRADTMPSIHASAFAS